MTYIERIFDVSTGETTEREFTKAEIDAAKKRETELLALKSKADEIAQAKLDLLNRLGISEEEAKLLLS